MKRIIASGLILLSLLCSCKRADDEMNAHILPVEKQYVDNAEQKITTNEQTDTNKVINIESSTNEAEEKQIEYTSSTKVSFVQKSFDEIMQEADIVVIAKYSGTKEQVIMADGRPATDHLMYISRLIKGSSLHEINVRMSYGVAGNTAYDTNCGYMDMAAEETFLIFLKKSESESEYGKDIYRFTLPDECVKLDKSWVPELNEVESEYAKKVIELCQEQTNSPLGSEASVGLSYMSFSEAKESADVIVIGRYTGVRFPVEANDNDKPFTDHEIEVEALIKGECEDTFRVRLGYGFSNGAYHESNAYRKLTEGHKYIFILKKGDNVCENDVENYSVIHRDTCITIDENGPVFNNTIKDEDKQIIIDLYSSIKK